MNKREDGQTVAENPPGGASRWLMLVDWLLPGCGFMIRGRWRRGISRFLLVMLTFGLGLLLHGGVAWPSWTPAAIDFNLINNFTFIVQLGAGLPSLASLAANQLGWAPLGGVPQDPYFELGGYYIVVAGALNYFATLNFYDRLVAVSPKFHEQEAPRAAGGES